MQLNVLNTLSKYPTSMKSTLLIFLFLGVLSLRASAASVVAPTNEHDVPTSVDTTNPDSNHESSLVSSIQNNVPSNSVDCSNVKIPQGKVCVSAGATYQHCCGDRNAIFSKNILSQLQEQTKELNPESASADSKSYQEWLTLVDYLAVANGRLLCTEKSKGTTADTEVLKSIKETERQLRSISYRLRETKLPELENCEQGSSDTAAKASKSDLSYEESAHSLFG